MHGRCGKSWYKFVLMAVAGIAVAGLVVMALWNWLVPVLFGLQQISFLQALGLLVFGRLLFGSLRCRPSPHDRWHRQLGESWKGKTPEEREKFRAGMRGCWSRCKSDDTPAEE